jgi:alanine racemase
MIEINGQNIIHNLKQIRQRVGKKTKIMAVVKANAYGHGLLPVAELIKTKIDWFGVNSLEEGLQLRQLKIKKPILLLGYLPLEQIKEAIGHDLSFVVYQEETIKKAAQMAQQEKKRARVHLKIETGTNRQGIRQENIEKIVNFCLQKRAILIEGIATHFANIEDTLDQRFALSQLKKFQKAVKQVQQKGIKPLSHTAASAAIILYPQTHFDLVRLGIALYGLWPSREVKILANRFSSAQLDLKPALIWKTQIAQIKKVPRGETIGYGRSYRANREMKIGVLPVGYWDGYDRHLSNCGRVLVKGQFAPVVGRVCMNMMMVDLTDILDVHLEEEVVLLGQQKKKEISAEELAERVGTINYEIVSRINPWLSRKMVLK